MRFVLSGMLLLSLVLLGTHAFLSPSQRSADELSSIVGALSESTDCLAGGNDCPHQENPHAATLTPCASGANEGDACAGDAWCRDTASGKTCQNVTYNSWNWDCVATAAHNCSGYYSSCVNMNGSKVCTGKQDAPSAGCGTAPQCKY